MVNSNMYNYYVKPCIIIIVAKDDLFGILEGMG